MRGVDRSRELFVAFTMLMLVLILVLVLMLIVVCRRFVASPNFQGWFNAKKTAAIRTLRRLYNQALYDVRIAIAPQGDDAQWLPRRLACILIDCLCCTSVQADIHETIKNRTEIDLIDLYMRVKEQLVRALPFGPPQLIHQSTTLRRPLGLMID
jgi:hypothetical protein